jgi:hypothetical protein
MRMEISSVSARPLMEGENPRTVAATSLSDIVYGFHVAGCCIETRSDPTTPGLAQTRSQPEAARTAPPKTAVAIVSLRMALGVPHSHQAVRHSRTTQWRLHLLAKIASFLSFKNSRRRARLAFEGTVAATNRGFRPSMGVVGRFILALPTEPEATCASSFLRCLLLSIPSSSDSELAQFQALV